MRAETEKIKGGKSAIVVIVHDDGVPSTCGFLAEEAEKNDICFTVALITEKIADPATGELKPDAIAYWQSLVDTGRFGISSHSRTHRFWGMTDEDESGYRIDNSGERVPYSVKKGQITREIAGSKNDLERAFPGQKFMTFIKPGMGRHENGVQLSDRAKEIIAENYIAMRNTGGNVDTVPPANRYNVKSLMVRAGEDPEVWKRSVDEAIERNGMIVYLFHGIADTEAGIAVTKEKAAKVFGYVGEKKKAGLIWVTTFERAMLYTEEYKTAKVKCEEDGEKVTVSVVDPSHDERFDEPLTVRAYLPEGKKLVSASVPTTSGRDADGEFLRFDLTPNAEKATLHIK